MLICKSSCMPAAPTHRAQVTAAKSMNVAVEFMYQSGLWLKGPDAKRLSDWIFCFLGHYAQLAHLTMAAGRRRYPMYPKCHMVCHAALALRRSSTLPWVLSPLATACQQEEDFIGKPSQLSRKTNIRQVHRSILWRSMIKIRFCLQEAAKDQRGMNAYPDLD